jgi:hypothetical protein
MIFLFSALLLNLLSAQTTTYAFANATIDISLTTSDSLLYAGTGDKCMKIIVRNSQVYHWNTNGVYQSWWKGSFVPYSYVKNISSISISDFGVSASGFAVAFSYTVSIISSKESITSLNADYSEASTLSHSSMLSSPPDDIFATDSTYFIGFSKGGLLAGSNSIIIFNKFVMGTVLHEFTHL